MIYSLLPKAQEDLRMLLERIAADNPNAAHRVRKAVLQTCTVLAENPHIAQEMEGPSITGVRRFPVGRYKRYTVFYTINEDEHEIEIIRLGHGGRDWEILLEEV